MADKKDAFEKGYCTASRCRQKVDPGHGIQWLDEEGELQRFCVRCYQRKCRDEEKEEKHG